MERNQLFKRLKGFQKAPRERFLLLARKQLTHEEFCLYELGIAITDWDSTHEQYGTFQAKNQDLAELLGWRKDSTVSRYRGSLIKKGLFTELPDQRIKVKNFQEWQIKTKKSAEMQSSIADQQDDSANLQTNSADIGEIQPQSINEPLVSSKGSLSINSLNESLSEEEINEIAEIFNNVSDEKKDKEEDEQKQLDIFNPPQEGE